MDQSLSQSEVKQLFIHQLNRVNCTKGYLIRNLPLLADIASFKNMKLAIDEALDDVKKQQLRIDEIYALLGSSASDEGCEVVKTVIEEAFNLGNNAGKTRIMNDMDIILYMQMIESMEFTSFRMLKLINQFVGNAEVSALLEQCCDENIDNDNLFSIITEEYLAQKTKG